MTLVGNTPPTPPQFTPAAGAVPPSAPIAAVHPGRPFNASARNGSAIAPPNAAPAEKSPVLSADVGTITVWPDTPCRTRRPSYDVKKNVRSFLIGPPKVPPN